MPQLAAHDSLNRRIDACRKCPRLTDYCREVAREKRASFKDWTYHGKPVPNFGDPHARLLIVGLAPAAHGANRTGRMFTGDRSGDFLYARLRENGFASQAEAISRDDGLELRDAMITATVHCAPPANKPTREERDNCSTWLEETFELLADLRVVLCLGKLAADAVLDYYKQRGWVEHRTDCPFEHGAAYEFDDDNAPALLTAYHPSQQNTFTGRLTAKMLREVFEQARVMLDR